MPHRAPVVGEIVPYVKFRQNVPIYGFTVRMKSGHVCSEIEVEQARSARDGPAMLVLIQSIADGELRQTLAAVVINAREHPDIVAYMLRLPHSPNANARWCFLGSGETHDDLPRGEVWIGLVPLRDIMSNEVVTTDHGDQLACPCGLCWRSFEGRWYEHPGLASRRNEHPVVPVVSASHFAYGPFKHMRARWGNMGASPAKMRLGRKVFKELANNPDYLWLKHLPRSIPRGILEAYKRHPDRIPGCSAEALIPEFARDMYHHFGAADECDWGDWVVVHNSMKSPSGLDYWSSAVTAFEMDGLLPDNEPAA